MIKRIFGDWSRRRFLKLALGTSAVSTVASCVSIRAPSAKFDHGVASGDPLQDAVIIWTRVTTYQAAPIQVQWTIADDEDLTSIVRQGTSLAMRETDFTVKVDVTGLAPGHSYYYGFKAGSTVSPIGHTRTLPAEGINAITLAVVSCSNYPAGHFNVYHAIAQRDDIDVVLHLGDYIYEYGKDGYGTDRAQELGRVPKPGHEITTLDDYRTRYAQYRSDPDLQALHKKYPFITVWDDHEVANDAWLGGAENHSEDEGDWEARKQRAMQSYYEWMPIRDQKPDHNGCVCRSFDFGDLATLIMLDTRMAGRDKQPKFEFPNVAYPFDFSNPSKPLVITNNEVLKKLSSAHVRYINIPFDYSKDPVEPIVDYQRIQALDPDNFPTDIRYKIDLDRFRRETLADPSRNLLGSAQETWLREQLQRSKANRTTWQILGQQVVMGKVNAPDLSDKVAADAFDDLEPTLKAILQGFIGLGQLGLPATVDSWDGYPVARTRLFDDLWKSSNNTVVLSGDSHTSSAFNLYNDKSDQQCAVEFGVPAVSSTSLSHYLPDVDPTELNDAFISASDQMQYINMQDRGYVLCRVSRQEVVASWFFVDTVLSRDYQLRLDSTHRVRASAAPGTSRLTRVD